MKFNKKKGFTLIEIIVCIALIAGIGTISIIGINSAVKKSEQNKINKSFSVFDNALDVYLSEHEEVYKNLKDNAEGAVISLELLKNEGLVADNIIDPRTKETIDYKNNYYVLSNAVLLEDTPEGEEEINYCENSVVGLEVLKSWDTLSKENINTSDVIYICPKNSGESDVKKEDIDKLQDRINSLESALSLIDLGGKNWVLFDVKTDISKKTYWPEENQDLWTLVKTEGNEMKLIYNNYVPSNNFDKDIKFFADDDSYTKCDEIYKVDGYGTYRVQNWEGVKYLNTNLNSVFDTSPSHTDGNDFVIEYNDIFYAGYYSLYDSKMRCYIRYQNSGGLYSTFQNLDFIKYHSNYGWTKYSIEDGWEKEELLKKKWDTENSKKQILYNYIKNNNFIITKDYYFEYQNGFSDELIDRLNYDVKLNDKFGTIYYYEEELKNLRNFLVGKNFFIGTYKEGFDYTGYAILSNGAISISQANNTNDNFINEDYYDSSLISPMHRHTVNYLYAINYIPVITINFNSLLTDIDDYPVPYKNKYTGCTTDKLGTKDCPYIIKLDDSTLSWKDDTYK